MEPRRGTIRPLGGKHMTKFEASLASINTHRIPEWHDDAKCGIFIH